MSTKKETSRPHELPPKQERFVQEYLVDLNATQAAIRAGYSKKTANEQGARLLAKASVGQAVQEALSKRARKTDLKAADVLEELRRLAFSDISTYVKWDEEKGLQILDSAELPDGAGACIKEVEKDNDGRLKLKLHDKIQALRDLARHLAIVPSGGEGPQLNVNVNVDQRREFFIQLGQILADTPDKKAAVAELIRQHLA